MRKFSDYESSQITPQHTLLQKLHKILEYLRKEDKGIRWEKLPDTYTLVNDYATFTQLGTSGIYKMNFEVDDYPDDWNNYQYIYYDESADLYSTLNLVGLDRTEFEFLVSNYQNNYKAIKGCIYRTRIK